MAYKRELIINNGSLTSYKKLLKVSDVCQLIDASKYPATKTINGVTFTNNGDGTITVNGTATVDVWYSFDFLPNWRDGGGLDTISKLLYIGCPAGGSNSTYGIYNGWATDDYQDIGSGAFTYTTSDKYNGFYRFSYKIGIRKGYTANNLVFKPMCINLTEMYGAGNEPKTVAEFKAKFPNELYDYSPRCWVTSYKTGLIAKTKNLLSEINPWINTKIENGVVHQNTADARELDPIKVQLYNGNTFVKGWNGDNQQIGKNTFTFTTDVLPTHTQIVFGLNGQAVDTTVTTSITLEDNTTYTLSMDFINITQGEIAWTNSMLEKGSTATDYVPYGYL